MTHQSFLKHFEGGSEPALEDLPRPQRTAYTAVELNGVEPHTFADKTGQEIEQVRTQLRLARETLGREGSR